MVKRMLIDATHPEETRVVVMDGTRLEEFDVETSTKKQNKGNIYLAKVIRVEPSLQAAFVDYGGNRHGFLAFSEIHPDYYQIPVADRERLLAEVQQHSHHDEDEGHHADEPSHDSQPDDHAGYHEDHDHAGHDHTPEGHPSEGEPTPSVETASSAEASSVPASTVDDTGAVAHAETVEVQQLSFLTPTVSSEPIPDEPEDAAPEQVPVATETNDIAPAVEVVSDPTPIEAAASDEAFVATMNDDVVSAQAANPVGIDDFSERPSQVEDVPVQERTVEVVGGEESDEADDEDGEDDDEDTKRRRRFLASRHYKIQEVIKRRQIMLVQVVKEERGNKGAALTTYLSLAGRYCVLMPNSSRGGGVSRKITNATDRRRLKSIMGELQPPKTAAVILRTAGAERSKPEIKRDYEYLMRTWDQIRGNTLQSRAPALIHEEGNLIKRAIRDVYSKDIEDVLVEGEEGYKTAKDFMRMLTPSHSKKVQRYDDSSISLFQRYQVESQLEAINTPVVQLRSGGSIVFGQTEALVAIDVNSGRATRERHIEETALKTNIEAADEIARQLRLRDLAGLVVIDFIDMEENRNNHAVERRLKEALKLDRARIQVGRISHFGLLELSRQRLRPSLIETNFRPCSHCSGTGLIRSTESASIYTLRMIEEEGIRRRSSELTVTVHPDVALYLLNYKREQLASLEARYGLRIFVLGDAHLVQPNLRIDRVKATRSLTDEAIAPPPQALPAPLPEPEEEVEDDVENEEDDVSSSESSNVEQAGSEGRQDTGRGRSRRRRRRGRGRDGRDGPREQFGERGPRPESNFDATQGGAVTSELSLAEGGETPTVNAPTTPGEDGQSETESDGRGGRRRRRGRRGGRRRRRDGSDTQGQNVQGEAGAPGESVCAGNSELGESFVESSSESVPALDTASNDDAPAAGGKRRGFFSAIKETALSWTRNDAADDTPSTAAPPAVAPPAVVNTPVASAPVVSAPVVSAPIVRSEPVPVPAPPPPPAPAPVQQAAPPPPAPVVEDAPSGPPKRGWWSQPKE